MTLRFLADQCVPLTIIRGLQKSGYEVLLLREVLPINSPDIEVIAKAVEMDLILLSLNGDFADIVSHPRNPIAALSLFNCIIIQRSFRRCWKNCTDICYKIRSERSTLARYSSSKRIEFALEGDGHAEDTW